MHLERLIAGYREFRRGRWPQERRRYEALAQGQSPKTFVISCCDSRVDPAAIFSTAPGEIFVARNVANLVPPWDGSDTYHETAAALEYAVMALNVETVLVLGHSGCGGVEAALSLQELKPGSALSGWIKLLEPALARCANHAGDRQEAVERESVRLSLERLQSFPFIADAIHAGGLALRGARFSIADGVLEVLDPATGEFLAQE